MAQTREQIREQNIEINNNLCKSCGQYIVSYPEVLKITYNTGQQEALAMRANFIKKICGYCRLKETYPHLFTFEKSV